MKAKNKVADPKKVADKEMEKKQKQAEEFQKARADFLENAKYKYGMTEVAVLVSSEFGIIPRITVIEAPVEEPQAPQVVESKDINEEKDESKDDKKEDGGGE